MIMNHKDWEEGAELARRQKLLIDKFTIDLSEEESEEVIEELTKVTDELNDFFEKHFESI